VSQLRLLRTIDSSHFPIDNYRQPTARTRAIGQCTLVTSRWQRALGAGSGVVEVRVGKTGYAEDSQSDTGVGDILSVVMRLAPR
jgi:hypothetical protein